MIIKLRERSNSFAGFSTYVTRYLIGNTMTQTFVMSPHVLPVNEIDALIILMHKYIEHL